LNGFNGQKDGTNAFIYSRFLVPYLQNFTGWAIFMDGDMVLKDDIAELWACKRDVFNTAVQVVQHDYKTAHPKKYIGTAMEAENKDYPRKNWSSVIIWNCGHKANQILTPEFVASSPGSLLHRFGWIKDDQIKALDPKWNAISEEQDLSDASLIHYSLGIPAIDYYQQCDGARHWHNAFQNAMRAGE
jgi:hypothetical protein